MAAAASSRAALKYPNRKPAYTAAAIPESLRLKKPPDWFLGATGGNHFIVDI